MCEACRQIPAGLIGGEGEEGGREGGEEGMRSGRCGEREGGREGGRDGERSHWDSPKSSILEL